MDSEFSIDPKELKNLVEESKKVKTIMGNPTFDLQDSELIAYKARRSLYAVKDIKKNELFTKNNYVSKSNKLSYINLYNIIKNILLLKNI